MISLGTPTPLARPRRVTFGPGELLVLQDALDETAGAGLPGDLRLERPDTEAAIAGIDLEEVLDRARAGLRDHGVLDGDRPGDAVLANLAKVTGSPRRLRLSLAGPAGEQVLGHWWSDAQLGGSLVRRGVLHTLSLFDARALGDELLAVVPDAEDPTPKRDALVAPLEALQMVPALDDLREAAVPEYAELVGTDARTMSDLGDWAAGVRSVLHVTALGARRARTLLWFLDRHGWWAATTHPGPGGVRLLRLAPRRRADLGAELGGLVSGAWL